MSSWVLLSRSCSLFGRLGQKRRAQVRGHDQHRVFEIHRAALRVGQPPVVHHLQQHVEHIRVRLLNLVEQDNRVRPAPNGLSQLPALVVADVPRRRADQPRHRVLLHVLAHVDAHHGLLVVEQKLRQRASRLRFAHTRRPKKNKRADGPLGIAQPRSRTPDRVSDHAQRLVLAHHALTQPILHRHQLLHFAFKHAAHRNARPLAHNFGDVFLVHFFFQHARHAAGAAGRSLLRAVKPLQLRFQSRQLSVLDLRGAIQHALACLLLGLKSQLLNSLLDFADRVDRPRALCSSAHAEP